MILQSVIPSVLLHFLLLISLLRGRRVHASCYISSLLDAIVIRQEKIEHHSAGFVPVLQHSGMLPLRPPVCYGPTTHCTLILCSLQVPGVVTRDPPAVPFLLSWPFKTLGRSAAILSTNSSTSIFSPGFCCPADPPESPLQ